MSLRNLQWNINGYNNNYKQLSLIIKDTNPDIICIQETHFLSKTHYFPTPTAYTGYFFNLNHILNAKQGICILIKKHLKHKQIEFESSIATLGIEIDLNKKTHTFHLSKFLLKPTAFLL